MKKLFALVALCAVAFSACEPNNNEQTEQRNANLVLNITAPTNGILEYPALGGVGEITFSLTEEETRSAAPAEVTATSDAEWISDITVGKNKITFTVAQNEDAEREDYITIKYKNQIKYVAVEQDGYERPDVTFKATHLNGTYWGKYPTTTGFNYLIILGDRRSPHYLTKESGSTEYRFNIYSDVSSAFNKIHRVPVGTYKMDHTSSGRPGTIDGHKDESYYLSSNDTDTPYADATMVVSETGIVVDVTFFDGKKHHIEYKGSLIYESYTEGTFADVFPVSAYTKDITFDVTGGHVDAYFRGDHYGTGCNVWFMQLAEEKHPHYNGVYIVLDLIVPKSEGGVNDLDIINGEYPIFKQKPENCEYTIPNGLLRDDCLQMHAWYLTCVDGQLDMSTAAPLTSGSVKVTKDGTNFLFEIDSTDDNGNKINGTFQGSLSSWIDQSCE